MVFILLQATATAIKIKRSHQHNDSGVNGGVYSGGNDDGYGNAGEGLGGGESDWGHPPPPPSSLPPLPSSSSLSMNNNDDDDDADEWEINGEKWWTTGANDPRYQRLHQHTLSTYPHYQDTLSSRPLDQDTLDQHTFSIVNLLTSNCMTNPILNPSYDNRIAYCNRYQ